jgi:hypothetical protein
MNRPSQQLFKVFILYFIYCGYMLRLLLAINKWNTPLTTDPLFKASTFNNEAICPSLDKSHTHIKKTIAESAQKIN